MPEVYCVTFTAPESGLHFPSLPQGSTPLSPPTSVAERLPGVAGLAWRLQMAGAFSACGVVAVPVMFT